MQMIPVRVFFEKTGRTRYTSHLDTMRTMTRAFRRSGLPFWYTQGFNPHLYMTFALPISLGFESLCESVDLRLTQEISFEQVQDRLNESLPPGLRVVRVAAPVMDPLAIAWADYRIVLRWEVSGNAQTPQTFRDFLSQPAITVMKRSKKGEREIDLLPYVQLLDAVGEDNTLQLNLRLSATSSANINPTLVLGAFAQWCGVEQDSAKVIRTCVYNGDMAQFL